MKYFYIRNTKKEILIFFFNFLLWLSFPSPIINNNYNYSNKDISYEFIDIDKFTLIRKFNLQKEKSIFDSSIIKSNYEIGKNFNLLKNYLEEVYHKIDLNQYIFEGNPFVLSSINNIIAKEDLIQDINKLFIILKVIYPESFINIDFIKKLNIIENEYLYELEKYIKDNNIKNGLIYKNIALEILKRVLIKYINNGHFILDNKFSLFNKRIFFYNNKLNILYNSDENFFYLYENSVYFKIELIDNDIPSKYLYFSFDKKENIFIGKFINYDQVKFNKEHTIEILLKDLNGKIIKKEIKLLPLYLNDFSEVKDDNKIYKDKIYYWKRIRNINYIRVKSFDSMYDNYLKGFVNDAEKLKREKFIIIDLRDNNGGSLKYIQLWLNKFFSSNIDLFYRGFSYENKLLYLLKMNYYKSINNIESYKYNLNKYSIIEEKQFSFDIIDNKKYRLENKENDNYIFIIQNYNTSSAAEVFIKVLKTFKNVFLIGTNSKGVMNFADPALIYLRNSKIIFYIGTKIIDHDLPYNPEGIGILPDIWTIEESLNYKYYIDLIESICNLKKKQNYD
ncbi:MAG: S41 family peptidase [Spirochaetes bacterium]|nr:S41 family peptidase [Spirochaetota bacterium]